MHLTTRNVNTAFRTLVAVFGGREFPGAVNDTATVAAPAGVVRRPSRNGDVLMIDEPVTVTYTHPRERVLFNPARDVNPFFHLYEALWMLAGRNDVASVAHYAKQMREYSDDGKTLNGAYGYRWRHAEVTDGYGNSLNTPEENDHGVDQLDILINHLKADPNSRRAVLQMWNVEDDLLKIGRKEYAGESTVPGSADVCCNLSVMFSLREETITHYRGEKGIAKEDRRVLDMTVTNRSNDLVWGLLGANYVHFTFLQEYVAARLGAEVGRYHHFTNNLHAYDWNFKPEEWLSDKNYGWSVDFYPSGGACTTVPLVRDPAVFERELPAFVSQYDGSNTPTYNEGDWDEPFLREVAAPALRAFRRWKENCPESASGFASQIEADDWRTACTSWLKRRAK